MMLDKSISKYKVQEKSSCASLHVHHGSKVWNNSAFVVVFHESLMNRKITRTTFIFKKSLVQYNMSLLNKSLFLCFIFL